MGTFILDIKDLHVYFDTPDGTAKVIDGLDLSLEKGETAALVGETGSGKSLTAKAILGLLPPTASIEGEILFKGEDILSLSEQEMHARRGSEISMIMQDPMSALNPVFTVGEQMVDVLKYQNKRRVGITDIVRDKFTDHGDLREEAIEMLRDVQMPSPERIFSSYPVELSGGMRQRVLIAIAFLSKPDLLIADEPSTALDVTTESKILDLIDSLVHEFDTTVLYITHDMGVAKSVSDTINVMYAGDIVEEAPSSKLFGAPLHPYTRGLLDSVPQLSEEMGQGIDGQVPDYTEAQPACRFAPRCPYAESECRDNYPYPREAESNHAVACHLYKGKAIYDRHKTLPSPQIGKDKDRDADLGPEVEL